MGTFPNARILHVDLEHLRTETEEIQGEIYRLYPGGSALASYLILREMPPNVDPLSPDNMLVFAVSPLTGLPVGGLSRMVVASKSPLTGTLGDSQSGGFFPAYLKANGWDAIVFRGRAPYPVYLFVDKDRVEIRSAQHLWGRVTGEVEDLIRDEVRDHRIEIAQIGPAGERRVRFACIISMCSRANGRNGHGAVMGSKNLKAVVIARNPLPRAVDPEGIKGLREGVQKRISENPAVEALGLHGTDADLLSFHEAGFLPTRNFQSGWFPQGASKITGTTMSETILKERDTCFGCAVRCKRVVEIPGKVNPRYGGPEYETCAAMGSYCGVGDLQSISISNQLCNMYGLDTISCGATIAFAMECYEKGFLTVNDTGGIELRFGDPEVPPRLVEMIANRTGLGDVLAEGSFRAANEIGKGAESSFVGVKGQEIPAHMPQFKPAVGLIYAVNPFGADHQSSEHDPMLVLPPDSLERKRLAQIAALRGYDNPFSLDPEKVRFAFDSQCFYSVADTLCLCQFIWGPSWQLYGPSDVVDLCRAGIGWETSLFELMRAGERRINMMRHFNAREGFSRSDDRLPDRFFSPLPDGPSKGIHIDRDAFEEALEMYYMIAGWDPATGNPGRKHLESLSLGWLFAK